MAWGTNPFTNFTSQPFGQSNTWSTGQQQNPWSQNAGQFNPQAMNFGQGGSTSQPYSWQGQNYSGGMMGSQGGGSMPSWMNQGSQGGYNGPMSGPNFNFNSPTVGPGMGGFGGMPPWMNQGGMGQMFPRGNQFGGSPYPNNPQIDPNTNGGAQGVTSAPMPDAQPGTGGNVFSNVIHNGSFDSANATLNPVMRRFLGM